MNIFSYIKEAIGTLMQNKMRSLLSLLGIVIGISSVVILTAIGEGMKASVAKDFWWTQNMIRIQPWKVGGNRWNSDTQYINNSETEAIPDSSIEQKIAAEKIFSRETVKMLESVFAERVKAVVPVMRFQTSSPVILMGKPLHETVSVVENSYFTARDMKVARGFMFTDAQIENFENVAIVSADMVSGYFWKTDPIGKTLYINNTAFMIIGVLQKTNDFSIRGIYIPLTTATKRFWPQKIESIEVYTHSTDTVESVQKDLWYFLMKYSGAFSPTQLEFHLFTNKQIIDSITKAVSSMAMFVSGIAAISLLVGGIGIMNIMLVSVTERTREIGIRKAIGARRRDIIFQFLTESVILSLIGGIVAVIFSYGICSLINYFLPKFYSIITIDTVILAASFSMFMGVIFGILPAWKAAKKDAIEALRFE